METCSLRPSGSRLDPFRPPAATSRKTKQTNKPTKNPKKPKPNNNKNPSLPRSFPSPLLCFLVPSPHKKLTLPLAVPDLLSLSRTALLSEASSQSLSSQSNYSEEGMSIFPGLKIVSLLCVSRTTKYGNNINIIV